MPDCTADRLRKLIAGYLRVDPSRVTDEAHLSDDLGIEWLDQIELLLIIEDEFAGIQFSDPPAIELVGDLLRYIEMTNITQSNLISAAA
ncbi:MAG TPA: acyl carrier protein [Terriglobales bacterium]|nr:acyl carrier protein [Terriglobales bacterium]